MASAAAAAGSNATKRVGLGVGRVPDDDTTHRKDAKDYGDSGFVYTPWLPNAATYGAAAAAEMLDRHSVPLQTAAATMGDRYPVTLQKKFPHRVLVIGPSESGKSKLIQDWIDTCHHALFLKEFEVTETKPVPLTCEAYDAFMNEHNVLMMYASSTVENAKFASIFHEIWRLTSTTIELVKLDEGHTAHGSEWGLANCPSPAEGMAALVVGAKRKQVFDVKPPSPKRHCPKDARIAELEKENAELTKQVADLNAVVAAAPTQYYHWTDDPAIKSAVESRFETTPGKNRRAALAKALVSIGWVRVGDTVEFTDGSGAVERLRVGEILKINCLPRPFKGLGYAMASCRITQERLTEIKRGIAV